MKKDWELGEQLNYNILDKLDLKPYIHQGDSIYNIMENIEDNINIENLEYEIQIMLDDPLMQRDIFNWISTEEFMDYLHERYGVMFEERIEYYVLRTSK